MFDVHGEHLLPNKYAGLPHEITFVAGLNVLLLPFIAVSTLSLSLSPRVACIRIPGRENVFGL